MSSGFFKIEHTGNEFALKNDFIFVPLSLTWKAKLTLLASDVGEQSTIQIQRNFSANRISLCCTEIRRKKARIMSKRC